MAKDVTDFDYTPELFKYFEEEYNNQKKAFYAKWKSKRIILIIAFLLAILPGLIYYFFSYGRRKNKHERTTYANNVVISALQHLPNVVKSVESVVAVPTSEREVQEYDLPLGKLRSFRNFFDLDSRWDKFWMNNMSNVISTENFNISQELDSFDLLSEITGRRRGFWGFVRKYTGNRGKLIKRTARFTSTVTAIVKLKSGEMIQFRNLSLLIDEYFKTREQNGEKGSNYKTVRIWSGLSALTSSSAIYKEPFKIRSKKFTTKRDKYFTNDFKKLEFELESVDFEDNFNLTIKGQEDPMAIRKQFTVKSLGAFLTLQEKSVPFIMSSMGSNSPISFLFDTLSGKGYDMPLNIERMWKFFKKEDYAHKCLNEEFSLLVNIAETIVELDRTKFFENKVKLTKK